MGIGDTIRSVREKLNKVLRQAEDKGDITDEATERYNQKISKATKEYEEDLRKEFRERDRRREAEERRAPRQ